MISQRYNHVRDEDPRRTLCPIRDTVTGGVLLIRVTNSVDVSRSRWGIVGMNGRKRRRRPTGNYSNDSRTCWCEDKMWLKMDCILISFHFVYLLFVTLIIIFVTRIIIIALLNLLHVLLLLFPFILFHLSHSSITTLKCPASLETFLFIFKYNAV